MPPALRAARTCVKQSRGARADGLAAQKVLAAAIESLDTGTVVQVR